MERCFFEHRDTYKCETLKCIWCERTYRSKGGLKRHLAFHKDRRHYICSFCGKNFSSGRELQNHKKIHFSEVVVAPKNPEKISFLVNIQVNSMEKPLKCSICSKRYAKELFLEQHMKLHVSKKLFSCSFCHRSFPYDCKLKKHMMIHTKGNRVKCKLCTMTFSCTKSLKKHCYHKHGRKKSDENKDHYQPADPSKNILSVEKVGSDCDFGSKIFKVESNARTGSFQVSLPSEEKHSSLVKSVRLECDFIFNETVFPKEEREDYSTSVRAFENTSRYSIMDRSFKEERDLEIQNASNQNSNVSEQHQYSDIIMVDQFEADVVHESNIDPLAL